VKNYVIKQATSRTPISSNLAAQLFVVRNFPYILPRGTDGGKFPHILIGKSRKFLPILLIGPIDRTVLNIPQLKIRPKSGQNGLKTRFSSNATLIVQKIPTFSRFGVTFCFTITGRSTASYGINSQPSIYRHSFCIGDRFAFCASSFAQIAACSGLRGAAAICAKRSRLRNSQYWAISSLVCSTA
jgi:hypothetical protein